MGGGCRTWETGSCPNQRPILQSQLSSEPPPLSLYLSVAFSLHPKHLTSLSPDSIIFASYLHPLHCPAKGLEAPDEWQSRSQRVSVIRTLCPPLPPPPLPPILPLCPISRPFSPSSSSSSPLPGLSQLGSVHFSMRWDRKHTQWGLLQFS